MSPRRLRELQATLLFVGTSLTAAVVVGAMQIGGWGGGRLDNRIEPLFWGGAILAAAGIALFAIAAVPGADDGGAGPRKRITAGLALVVLGPVLCVVAVFADYWI